jgi:hypothetical protein
MPCFLCDRSSSEPGEIIKLQAGFLYEDRSGIQFQAESFDDGEGVKWVCYVCAANRDLFEAATDWEYCCLCGQTIDTKHKPPEDVIIRIETGVNVERRKGLFTITMFRCEYHRTGHVHLICACDDWNLPLGCLSPQDAP